MARKIRVGMLFGGRSAEHEVSLQSAKNIIDAIDTNKYEVVLIGIDKKGQWHLNEESRFLLPAAESGLPELPERGENLALVPGKQNDQLVALSGQRRLGSLDVIFPVLHGPFGEDGTVQGLLKLANIAFVGAGVLGSSVGMDKDVTKRLLRDAGIPIARFIVAKRYSLEIGFIILLHQFQARFCPATNFTRTKRNISMRTALSWKYQRTFRRRFRNVSASWLSKRFPCSVVREWRASISSCEPTNKLSSTSSTLFLDSPE